MVKWQLSGCELSSAIVDAMREMAFRLSSDSVGVGRPINLAAMFVTRVSMTRFLTVSKIEPGGGQQICVTCSALDVWGFVICKSVLFSTMCFVAI